MIWDIENPRKVITPEAIAEGVITFRGFSISHIPRADVCHLFYYTETHILDDVSRQQSF